MVFCFNIYAGKKFKGGFKGGINLSSFITQNSTKHYWAAGSAGSTLEPSFVTGCFISYSFNKYIIIQVELLYTKRKYHVEYENHVYGSGDYYSQLSKWDGFQKLVYLEFPFIIKSTLVLSQKEICKPYVGICHSTLLEKKYEYDFSYTAKNSEGEITEMYERTIEDVLSDVKPSDLGLIIGAEVSLSRILEPLFIDIRFTVSLDKINENTLPGSVRNLTFICLFGIALCLHKSSNQYENTRANCRYSKPTDLQRRNHC